MESGGSEKPDVENLQTLVQDQTLIIDWLTWFCSHRFPDNFEKLSPPILQLDEVEFYYSPDQQLFSGLNLSADLESRICIVRVIGTIYQSVTGLPFTAAVSYEA